MKTTKIWLELLLAGDIPNLKACAKYIGASSTGTIYWCPFLKLKQTESYWECNLRSKHLSKVKLAEMNKIRRNLSITLVVLSRMSTSVRLQPAFPCCWPSMMSPSFRRGFPYLSMYIFARDSTWRLGGCSKNRSSLISFSNMSSPEPVNSGDWLWKVPGGPMGVNGAWKPRLGCNWGSPRCNDPVWTLSGNGAWNPWDLPLKPNWGCGWGKGNGAWNP